MKLLIFHLAQLFLGFSDYSFVSSLTTGDVNNHDSIQLMHRFQGNIFRHGQSYNNNLHLKTSFAFRGIKFVSKISDDNITELCRNHTNLYIQHLTKPNILDLFTNKNWAAKSKLN